MTLKKLTSLPLAYTSVKYCMTHLNLARGLPIKHSAAVTSFPHCSFFRERMGPQNLSHTVTTRFI